LSDFGENRRRVPGIIPPSFFDFRKNQITEGRNLRNYIYACTRKLGCRDSSVGIATRYGLDGPEIESRWKRDFPYRPERTWSPPSLQYNAYQVFPRGKAAGAWPWPPTPSNAEVKERVELYLYSLSGPSWPVLGWTLPLPLPLPLPWKPRTLDINNALNSLFTVTELTIGSLVHFTVVTSIISLHFVCYSWSIGVQTNWLNLHKLCVDLPSQFKQLAIAEILQVSHSRPIAS